jgi:hypothetical protein
MASITFPSLAPLIAGDKTAGQVTSDICAPLERRASGWWWLSFLAAFSAMLLGVAAVTYQLVVGIGTWRTGSKDTGDFGSGQLLACTRTFILTRLVCETQD